MQDSTVIRRRTFNRMLGGAAAWAVASPAILRAQTAKELVIVSYGGELQQAHRWLADRMEKNHSGLKIKLVPSEDQDIVAQIKAARGASPYDCMPNGEPPHLIGIRDGYIQKVKPEKLSNYGALYSEFTAKSQGYGVPATYTLVGIAYMKDQVKTPPKSWEDMWKPEFKGLVGFPRPTSNLGLGALVIVAKIFGGSETNLDPAFQKLKELKPVVASSPQQTKTLMERQEIALAPLWNTDTATIASKGMEVAFVKPDPGPVAIISFMSEITNTAHPDLVYEWMDGIISKEYQAYAAEAPFYFGITRKDVEAPAAARAYTPATPDEVLKLQTVDWSKIVPQRGEIVDRFRREFGA